MRFGVILGAAVVALTGPAFSTAAGRLWPSHGDTTILRLDVNTDKIRWEKTSPCRDGGFTYPGSGDVFDARSGQMVARLTAARGARGAGAPGWVDLLAGPGLKGWKRVPIPPDKKLGRKDPWKLGGDGKTLVCDGVGVKEMLLYDRPWKDGVFHVEWRFRKVAGTPEYNSGVYVRTAADGSAWVQAQVAHTKKPPRLGDLFSERRVNGKVQRVVVPGSGAKLARPPGEWNTYEVTCKGKAITVRVNGELATSWEDCPMLVGRVGLQAEYYAIEFKNLKFKPLD